MNTLSQFFEDRWQEIETYLDLLEALERQVQNGAPQIASRNQGYSITPQQQKILNSGIYLQLYSLIEATVSKCLESVIDMIIDTGTSPKDLSDQLRREWVRFAACTHKNLSDKKRLDYAYDLCEHVISVSPISDFKVETGGGGNWDDENIYKLSTRIGLNLRLSSDAQRAVKQKIQNDMGAMKLIREYRNALSHGNLSFIECSENNTVNDLRDLAEKVSLYLTEVINQFQTFIDNNEFLDSEMRPDLDIQ